jgi:putative nucleotidyltransferase with HDIG domain
VHVVNANEMLRTGSSPLGAPSIAALTSLIRALETVEGGLYSHCARVAHNATALGTAIGLDPVEVSAVYTAAVLHDVGKMGVAPAVLAKAGALTAVERAQIEEHSAIGAHMVLAVSSSLSPVADGVRAHHERWDGHGYPFGLSATAIPLAGRLIAVADVFDALTSARPYRARALSSEGGLEYLRLEIGKAFEPDLVREFERLFDDGALILHDGAS